jgi:hypothetical protein
MSSSESEDKSGGGGDREWSVGDEGRSSVISIPSDGESGSGSITWRRDRLLVGDNLNVEWGVDEDLLTSSDRFSFPMRYVFDFPRGISMVNDFNSSC